MNDTLSPRISTLSDDDLIRLLTVDADQYRQEAIALARIEANRRNLAVDSSLLAAPAPRLSFVAATRAFGRRIPRSLIVAACLGSLPFALSALFFLFGAFASQPSLVALPFLPGLLLNGLFSGNFDSAFDSAGWAAATFLASWVFWTAACHFALRLLAALKRP